MLITLPAPELWPRTYASSIRIGPVWLIYGAMRDKSVEEITEILFPLASHVILTIPAYGPRALRPEAVMEVSEHPSMEAAPDLARAIERSRSAPDRLQGVLPPGPSRRTRAANAQPQVGARTLGERRRRLRARPREAARGSGDARLGGGHRAAGLPLRVARDAGVRDDVPELGVLLAERRVGHVAVERRRDDDTRRR